MKLGLVLFLFFTSSLLLVWITIEHNIHDIDNKYIGQFKLNKIQRVSSKQYARTRKEYIPKRSYFLAKREIDKILLINPITFNINDTSPIMKSTLIKIVKVINHLKEDVVLSIFAHTDAVGSAQHNLRLSQKRADILKSYFIKRVNIPFIVAIGYGESFSLSHRLIEINLKRIKQ